MKNVGRMIPQTSGQHNLTDNGVIHGDRSRKRPRLRETELLALGYAEIKMSLRIK
jgi:hypothetical protein